VPSLLSSAEVSELLQSLLYNPTSTKERVSMLKMKPTFNGILSRRAVDSASFTRPYDLSARATTSAGTSDAFPFDAFTTSSGDMPQCVYCQLASAPLGIENTKDPARNRAAIAADSPVLIANRRRNQQYVRPNTLLNFKGWTDEISSVSISQPVV